jgi:iron complex outermembrane receptor protein
MKSFAVSFITLLIMLCAGSDRTVAQCINTCSHDSVWTVCLSEVNITPCNGEGDAVYNFFKPNKSFTTEDILSRIPSLSMTRRSSFGQEPGIRGLSGSRINVSLDGMKIFGACTDKMDPVTIYVEPQNLESFEAANGVCGTEQGSCTGGSLDMKLKDPDFNSGRSLNGLTGLTWHSASNALSAFAGLEFSDRKIAAKLNGVFRKSGDYTAGGGRKVPFSQYEKNNASLSLKYKLPGSQSVKLDFLTDNGKNIGFPALTMDVRRAEARIASFSWEIKPGESFIKYAEVKIYTNTIRHLMDDRDRSGLIMYMDMPGKSRTDGLYLSGNLFLSRKIFLNTRVDYYSNTLFAEMFMYPEGGRAMYMLTLPETKRQVGGIYLSPEWTIDSLSSVRAGIRRDLGFTEMNDELGLAQLGIFYKDTKERHEQGATSFFVDYKRKVGGAFLASIQAGWSERIPSVQEMYGYYLFNRLDACDYIGNPDLKNESATQLSVMLQYDAPRINLSASPFLTWIDNYVEGMRQEEYSAMTAGAEGVKLYRNNGSASMKGAEFSLKLNAEERWSMIHTTKYVHGEKKDGTPMWQIPPLKSLTSVRYRRGLFNIQAESEWAASQKRIDPASGEIETPAYIIFNIRFSATWMHGKQSIEFNGGVENISDRNYHEHLDWGGVPRPGRNFYSTLAFRF